MPPPFLLHPAAAHPTVREKKIHFLPHASGYGVLFSYLPSQGPVHRTDAADETPPDDLPDGTPGICMHKHAE